MIEHEGIDILFMDFSELSTEGVIALLEEAKGVIHSSPPKSLKVLTDVSNARYDKITADAFAAFSKSNNPFIAHSAVIGMTGMKRVLFNFVMRSTGRKVHLHRSRKRALNWLKSQEIG